MGYLTSFELDVMDKLLAGDHPVLAVLREQLRLAVVEHRKLTGVGFFVEFGVPSDVTAASVRDGRIHFGDVEAKVSGLKYGAGFVLFIKDGKLQMLEGYSYDEPWPEEIESFELKYSEPSRAAVMKALE
jgi:hypothetical protein